MANISKNTTVNQLVGIEDFEDPVYALNTLGKATNIIARSSFIGNYTTRIILATGGNGWNYSTSAVQFASGYDT